MDSKPGAPSDIAMYKFYAQRAETTAVGLPGR